MPNSFTAEFNNCFWYQNGLGCHHQLICSTDKQIISASLPMLQALSSSQSTPMVRVPWSEPGIIMRMLDLGVLGIIAPMINNKQDCERFVSYCYYPSIDKEALVRCEHN